jgi:glycosyltransferase involved in cell wall biosynthesis
LDASRGSPKAIDRLRDPALRAAMGKRGREAAEREHNWGTMRERLQKAYSRLLSADR